MAHDVAAMPLKAVAVFLWTVASALALVQRLDAHAAIWKV